MTHRSPRGRTVRVRPGHRGDGLGVVRPRRAGINAFGFGGTNAHAVLEQAPPSCALPPGGDVRGPNLLTLSAGSAAGLDAWTARVSERLRDRRSSRRAMSA
ncbi:ketoacyl-synthetase C-terminal extension domain-containing protein [Streptomyces sp. INA 01156]